MTTVSIVSLILGLLTAGIRLATPLIFAALGETISERAGILNLGLEGMMLGGAFFGFAVAAQANSPWLGVGVAIATGGLVSLIHAWVSIDLHGDQVVSGIALNIIILGLTSYLNRAFFSESIMPVRTETLGTIAIPWLSEIPFFGELLFQHNALVYIAFLCMPLVWFILKRTTWGLMINSVGEYPLAAESSGISVRRVRYLATLSAGVLAGLSGAFLSLGQFNMFSNGMTDGRGYIVLAVVIFGKWNPYGVVKAALLFGLADALQYRAQAFGFDIAYQFLLMLPYILTMLALMGIVGKTRAPSALAQPYIKEKG